MNKARIRLYIFILSKNIINEDRSMLNKSRIRFIPRININIIPINKDCTILLFSIPAFSFIGNMIDKMMINIIRVDIPSIRPSLTLYEPSRIIYNIALKSIENIQEIKAVK